MKLLTLLAISFQAHAFFSSYLSNNTQNRLRGLIIQEKEEKFIEIWGDAKKGEYLGEISGKLGLYYLDRLTSHKKWDYQSKQKLKARRICFPSAVKHLISLGAKPSTDHAIGSYDNFCPQSLRTILDSLSQKQVSSVTRSWKLSKYVEFSNDKEVGPKIIAIATALLEKNKKQCKKSNENCLAVNHVKKEISWLEEYEKKKQFNKTPEGQKSLLIGKICFHYLNAQRFRKKIQDEKERGRISGFVNASNMKEWGDKTFYEEKEMNKLVDRYKKRYRRKYNPINCSR